MLSITNIPMLSSQSQMHFGFWNLRGLNDPLKQAKLFLKNNDLSLIGLIEHKIKEPNIKRIMKVICPHWRHAHNSTHAPIGRILVCWDPQILDVKVLHMTSQLMHCEVHSIQDGYIFVATLVYGANDHIERLDLWNELSKLKTNDSWVILGDFNAIRKPMEKAGGLTHWPPHMDDLNKCLFSCEVDDLRFSGCLFTWSNRQDPPHHISSKLDRVLVNDTWIRTHTSSSAFFPTPGISDHLPAVIHITPPPKPPKRPFRFFDFLADHPSFLPTVQKVWRQIIIGNLMFSLTEKLKRLQVDLKKLNHKEFSAITERVSASKFQLDTLQTKLGTDPTNIANQMEEKWVFKQFLTLSRAEESLAKQKSRIQWLKLGDQCTSFFFKSVNNNRNRSKITSLVLGDSTITHDMNVIKDTFVSFYTGLLGKPHSTSYAGYDRINQLITKRLTNEQSVSMVQEVSNNDIKDMFMGLNPHKAPGPDGYNAKFFQKAWLGHEVTAAIRNFFKSGKLLSRANATIVALVPKVPNPSKVGDYRPISCCNVVYKCIAKILARRLQSALPDLIDPVQSGFVKGRRIADNIFLTQEIMQGYHRSTSSPKCTMKVDIMKAYDNVRWDFLWDTLTCMNFHPKMITWLKACVTTANYALNINGDPTGNIKGERGLRQGDPLSSYLFVIVMEVLTCILKEKSNEPDFKFHWRCNQPKIINLCFADDLMLFCKGDVKSVKHIQDSLSEFESLSGLSPSPGKSSVFFSGVQHSIRNEILQLLGFKEGTLPVRYLGVPLLSTKLKYIDCKTMIDKITSRTKTWTNRDLTYAGRVQLIKNVLFSMQTSWSSLFILPNKVIKELNPYLGLSFGLAQTSKRLGLRFHGNICAALSKRVA